ncbi:hypothetical protein [Flammeovirga sp. SJP92]
MSLPESKTHRLLQALTLIF